MRALNVNFAPRRTAPAAWLLLVIGVLGLSLLMRELILLSQAQDQLHEAAAALRRKTTVPRGASEAQIREALRPELTSAREVAARITLPWNRLFEALESVADANATLLSLEPDPEKGMVRISGEAKDFAAVLAYRKRLLGTTVFDEVHLLQHQVLTSDPQRPVRFTLTAHWT